MGRGRHIDISMLEALVEWMGYPLYYSIDGAPPPGRTGASHATIYPYGPFPAGDGRTVMLGLQNEREWSAFCDKVLQRPGLAKEERFAGNARRLAARDVLHAIIVEVFSKLTAEQVLERIESAQIASAQVNDMAGVWAHPQLAARGRWHPVATPAGEVPALAPPGGAGDPRMDAVPALGEHTDAILSELGYDADAISALRSEGAT
jgi:crotonobetainyl-CoA:carnitine CoA-transferase CaiB-like acyl-CoA transferase